MKNLNFILQSLTFFLITVFMFCCSNNQPGTIVEGDQKTWAEKLGYPANKKIIILHADDAGMCDEANIAAFNYLEKNEIQSTAGMVPCEFFDEFAAWAIKNPEKDMGLHLTLTSEWETYRWGPVSNPAKVPGLVDPDGFLWHEVPDVASHASAEEVEREIRAQIKKAISLGMKVDHIDTHMGTLFGRLDYTKVYLKVAEEYGIPAMVISLTDDEVVKRFQMQGYPISKETQALLAGYKLPQLDDFRSVPPGKTYEEKIRNFFSLVNSLRPGITEIIFHPSVPSENLKTITNVWRQRVWEAEMFSDPQVIQFFTDEQIVFTNWIEMMKKFRD